MSGLITVLSVRSEVNTVVRLLVTVLMATYVPRYMYCTVPCLGLKAK